METSSIRKARLEQAQENRENLVVKLTITGHSLAGFDVFTMTDLPDGRMHVDPTMQSALGSYCEALKKPPEDYAVFRAAEQRRLQKRAEKRNVSFYLNRLNLRYIGAYLNGRRHAKAYRKTFSEYIGGK